MKLGFIGTGVISDAMIRGLLSTDDAVSEIIVSRRGREFSQKLAAEFDAVRVEDDNQAIMDAADIVFLAVRPQIAEQVLSGLKAPANTQIVSLIATIPIAKLQGWISGGASFDRAIPLPSVAHCNCVTAVYPGAPDVIALFEKLGGAVAADTIDAFDGYAAGSALMATYFEILESSAQWMVAHGSDYADARRYLAALFAGLSDNTIKSPDQSFANLVEGHSTPGGLNEQVAQTFMRQKGGAAIHSALDDVFARIKAASSDN